MVEICVCSTETSRHKCKIANTTKKRTRVLVRPNVLLHGPHLYTQNGLSKAGLQSPAPQLAQQMSQLQFAVTPYRATRPQTNTCMPNARSDWKGAIDELVARTCGREECSPVPRLNAATIATDRALSATRLGERCDKDRTLY